MKTNSLSLFLKINNNNDRKNKNIFILIIICQFLFLFILFISYSSIYCIMNGMYGQNQYNIKFIESHNVNVINNKLREFNDYDNCVFYLSEDLIASKLPFSLILEGREIQNNNEIIISEDSDFKIGETLNILDKDYIIVGRNNRDYNEINVNSLALYVEIDEIILIKHNLTNNKLKNSYINSLNIFFKNSNVIKPSTISFAELFNYNDYFRIITFILLLSFIALILSYYYKFNNRKDIYVVHKLLGMSDIKLYCYNFIEICIVIFIEYILSMIIYYILYFSIFKKIHMYTFNTYHLNSIKEISLITLLYFILLIICSYISFLKLKIYSIKDNLK